MREINQDACLDQPKRGLWAVAEGMGGHSLGEPADWLAGARDAIAALPPQ